MPASLSTVPDGVGAIYVNTNRPAGNQVRRFARNADGTIGASADYATGGSGTGAGLGSQGALALSTNGHWLVAVNAGSNDVSVFRASAHGLELTDRTPSGGTMPISVTVSGSLVYTLNAGGAGNISGFRLSNQGDLEPLAGSTRPLSSAGAGPAQVSFTPDARWLVVTEKANNRIVTYALDADGRAQAPVSHPSAGTTPFGFAFAGRDRLIVSEAFGGAVDGSAASSYRLSGGSVQVVSASVPTTETAACWTVATPNGRFAYVSNAGSASLTGYAVGHDGALTILDADGKTGTTAGNPLDAAVNGSGRYLYTVNGNGTVSAFAVAADGSLTNLGSASGLPAGSVGIAAR
jgi:6-phosphogluconolactonase (cycloisomerase 2 family)